jgi:hypothetical protein
MTYKVLDILKDLPGTNCGECGRSGCFAFATAVYLDGADPAGCPHLDPTAAEDMRAKIKAGRGRGEGRRDPTHVQALNHLLKKMGEADLASLAANAGAVYEPGPPPAVLCDFLGQTLRARTDDVTAENGEPPSVWVKIFLFIYLTRASGRPPKGAWAAYRELPNSTSKSRSFEACANRIAEFFGDRTEALQAAALALGGTPVSHGSADHAYLFRALPRVDLLLLYWEGGEEFSARAALLVDRDVLDYLDQEALVFLAEAFAQRMMGKNISEVIP